MVKRRIFFTDGMENGGVVGSPPPGQLLLKILVPGYAAGAIIGKGGQIIVQLQKETGAIIKLSKAKDFYPGRVFRNRGKLAFLTNARIVTVRNVTSRSRARSDQTYGRAFLRSFAFGLLGNLGCIRTETLY